jgi:uncharacterized protein (TIGR03067 family)
MRAQTLWAVAVVGMALAAAGAANDAKDQEALQGTWRCTASEINGDKQADDEVKQYTLEVDHEKLAVRKSGDLVMRGTYKTDPAQNPRHIDFKLEENPGNPDDVGKTLPGIYALDGDELKWCFTLPDRSERPKEFKADSGSSQVNAVLKREKK